MISPLARQRLTFLVAAAKRHLMAILGAAIGVVAGLGAFGAVLGLLVGALADQLVWDRLTIKRTTALFVSPRRGMGDRSWTRVAGYIALGGCVLARKVGQDGVTLVDIEAFKDALNRYFGFSGRHAALCGTLVERFFEQGRVDPLAFADLFGEEPEEEREHLVQFLFPVAADEAGRTGRAPMELLQQLSSRLGLPEQSFHRIRVATIRHDEEAYSIIGVAPEASLAEIRRVYLKLADQFHPDHAAALGEEQKRLTQEAFVRIRSAYDRIISEREPQT